ncbi:hypothetical protein C943_04168 [Mariniradius saccharolyticus AK6]|uniref:Bacteriophage T5 Orf172 DNA-binding domain-containing protein n=2 Tax=Mariniradius TaxID=1245590 RepID=M7XGA0_9BACT|nr:hypothetical protein C943_04168 [Mariniradius saccharolyticus AK6]
MPGLVKVGKSTRSPEIRATELSQASGVPHSFQIVYQTLVDNCDLAEREVHRFLNAFRENSNREFFRIPVNRAIDVLRKVISENNLKESDHEIDPYRFAYEEFHSAEALFEKVISNEKYWEQAKLHLKEGFLINWLKNKSEFDALVNAEQYKARKNDIDYYFSVIVFSIVPGNFRIFGYNISSVGDIRNYFEQDFENDRGFLTLYLSGKLSKIYEGFLNSKGTTENQVSKFLSFSNSSSGKPLEERKKKLRKILEWKSNSNKFLHFDSVNFEKVDYLLKKSEWNEQAGLLNIPYDITEKAFSKEESEVIESVNYLNRVKSLLFDTNSNLPQNKDLSKFVSRQDHLREIGYLTGSEYLSFLKCKYSMDDFKKINNEYMIPKEIWNSFINPKSFFEFLINRDYLLYLVGEYSELKGWLFAGNSYRNYYEILEKRVDGIYENAETKDHKRELIYSQKNWIIFKNYVEQSKILKDHFSSNVGFLISKVELAEKTKYLLEKYLIPVEQMNGIKTGDFDSLNEFYLSKVPKIEKSVLEDRLIHEKIRSSLKNGCKKDFEDSLSALSKTFKKESTIRYQPLYNSSLVTNFSLEFIPTNQFLSTLSLPGQLRKKLRSDNCDEYLEGLSVFFEYANFWIPKKTHKVLEDEFVLPLSVLRSLIGINIDEYLRSVEFLIANGLEIINGLEENSTNLGVKGFLINNWGPSKSPNDRRLSANLTRNQYSNLFSSTGRSEFSFFEKGKFSYKTDYNNSRSKVLSDLWDGTVDTACLVFCDHKLITKKEISDYRNKLGEDALSYFHLKYGLNIDDYSEAKKVLSLGYDKRLDSRISYLIKNVDLRFRFLPEELRKYLKNYLANLMNLKISFSNVDSNIIAQLEEYSQMNSFSFTLKKRKFHSFLKDNYYRISTKNDFWSGMLNYLNENS